MKTIKVYGFDTDDGYRLKSHTAEGEYDKDDSPYNTVIQCLRNRSVYIKESGFLRLDNETYGHLDKNRLL